ncbi:uncharacterized protein LOC142317662 [Lycorma delicatula]|uniref:uncharacterized protein LOC142317662 n=1 Tax=Lycorma delicatula TaxID=130591 RepID=UPI003F5143A4
MPKRRQSIGRSTACALRQRRNRAIAKANEILEQRNEKLYRGFNYNPVIDCAKETDIGLPSVIEASVPAFVDIKLEIEHNVTECLFLPHFQTEDDAVSEREIDSTLVEEDDSFDPGDGDIPTDPLAIEETSMIKNEVEIEESLVNDDSLNRQFAIETGNSFVLSAKADNVTNTENIKEHIVSDCIMCKKQIRNYLHDKVMKTKCDSCEISCRERTLQLQSNSNMRLESLREIIDSENEQKEDDEEFLCTYCNKMFQCKLSLRRHVNIHTKGKKYVCNCCQKSFIQSSHLKQHLVIHTSEKLYVCNFCQKSFNRSSNLLQHLNIHTKEKSYTCNFCQKAFNYSFDLKRHLNNHTKEKMYVCEFCQRSFNCNSNLTKHRNIHTKEQTYDCVECKKSFYWKSHLTRHINSTHKKNCLVYNEKYLTFWKVYHLYNDTYHIHHDIIAQSVKLNVCVIDSKMDSPVPTSVVIKSETEPGTFEETVCLFLPHFPAEHNATSEHEIEGMQLKEDPLYMENGDTSADPLATERTKIIKCEDLQIKSEALVTEESLIDDVAPLSLEFEVENDTSFLSSLKTDDSITSNHLQVNSSANVENSECKKQVKTFIHDEVIKITDVRSENLDENINSENTLTEQKGDVEEFVCKYCNKRLQCKFSLMRHINIHTKEKMYLCNFCPKSFNDSSNFKIHLNIHTKEKTYICNICQKSFNFSSALKRHINMHTKEKKFVCRFCLKSFDDRFNLKQHIDTHANEKKYACNFCQKAFHFMFSLNKHLNSHTRTNKKKYICTFCQKSFIRSCNLKQHVNIHTKEKKYICSFCQKSFYDNSNLKQHLNKHTNEKKYICNFCQKSFYRPYNLKQHLNTHTKEKKYDCIDCKKSFTKKYSLVRHINCIHKSD